MRFPGDPSEVAAGLVSAWRDGGSSAADPLLGAVAYLRDASAYHKRFGQEAAATAFEEGAALFEAIITKIHDIEISYDEAAALGPWARGTIKNKKGALQPAARGTVRLADIPLKASESLAGLRALRAAHLIDADRARSEAEAQGAATGGDEAWAQAQIDAMSE